MIGSTVTLGDFLDFLLLLKSVGWLDVSLLNINDLISQNLSNALLGSESVLPSALGDQVDGLVDSSEGRDINCLLSNHTSSANSGWIFSWSCKHKCANQYFQGISSCEEVDDLECMSDDSDGFNFLSCVSSVELEGSNKSLDDGAKCFSEFFALVSACSMRDKDLSLGCSSCDVINEAWVGNLRVMMGVLWCHHRTILRRA